MRLGRNGLAALVAVLGLVFAQPVLAQAQQGEEHPFKQVKLTDAHIKGFIAAHKEMAALAQEKSDAPSDAPDPKLQAALEQIAQRHGFQSFIDFDDIAFNISLVMGGLDPQTGAFTDPITSIRQEIADIKADKTIPEKDKKQMLEELDEALKHTPPLQYPENVDLVKKYRVDIEQVLQ